MLQYSRREQNQAPIVNLQEESVVPLLTYCNWSYAPTYHIDTTTLENILRHFNEDYIPYYLRILNETPNQVVQAFLEQCQISKESLNTIYENLLDNGFRVKNVNL